MLQPKFAVSACIQGPGYSVSARGVIDEGSRKLLGSTLQCIPRGGDVVVDLDAVTAIGPECIELLHAHLERLQSEGGSLMIRRPSDVVRRELYRTPTRCAIPVLLERPHRLRVLTGA